MLLDLDFPVSVMGILVHGAHISGESMKVTEAADVSS